MTTTSIPQHKIDSSICHQTLEDFKHLTRQYALFHISFFSAIFLELTAFVLFFSFLTQTTTLAFSLAALFFTAFTYFILLFYLQAKKPEDILRLKNTFLSLCAQTTPSTATPYEKYQFMASALEQFIADLHNQEYTYYSLPPSLRTLSPLMEKFSAWVHWKDLHKIKELVLMELISANIALVKLKPTDVKIHASLAKTYEVLAWLHTNPQRLNPEASISWVPPEYNSSEMLHKRQRALLKALEEYKIVLAYAPHEPWIYPELASVYRELERPQEEIQCYETLLNLSPTNSDISLRLGTLYFEQGLNARGLDIYKKLLEVDPPKADQLIALYEASSP